VGYVKSEIHLSNTLEKLKRFAKSIDALKPGGVLALVTSHYTLDKQNRTIREYLASKADLVGAIRLPSDA
jgi:adenine-specific DNA methylase